MDCYQCSPPPGLVNRQMGIVAIRPEGLPRTAPGLGVIAHFDSASEAVLQKDPFLVNRIAMAQKMQPYTPVVGDGQTTVRSAGRIAPGLEGLELEEMWNRKFSQVGISGYTVGAFKKPSGSDARTRKPADKPLARGGFHA